MVAPGCIIKYKDTNLKAIHNSCSNSYAKTAVVLSNTKIQIWKQFTTGLDSDLLPLSLYYQIQRYKFESNSQLQSQARCSRESCIIKYKDTNLKAIHNYICWRSWNILVVLSNTKIQIWKQFTTLPGSTLVVPQLYYQIQRYKFESNSQQQLSLPFKLTCCIIKYKDTNLKAIHNTSRPIGLYQRVVLSNTKIQIWKQFTTVTSNCNSSPSCIIKYKDTNLKAIHNNSIPMNVYHLVVLSNTKIQIWKQFTTNAVLSVLKVVLYYQIQRYKFESNSQQL